MPKPTERRGWGGWRFLAVVLLLYAATALWDVGRVVEACGTFLEMLGRVLPVLGLVMVLIFLFDLFLSPQRVERYLGGQSGLKGWVLAVGTGILSTGPIYAWYALLSELRHKGMKASLAAAMLYARAVKFPLLPLMVHYFGLRYTLVLSLYLILFSVLSGLLMGRIMGRQDVAGGD